MISTNLVILYFSHQILAQQLHNWQNVKIIHKLMFALFQMLQKLYLKCKLNNESKVAIKWLKDNQMIANPSKFQAIFLNKSKEHIDTNIEIDGNIIDSSNLVTLLGLEIDDKLNFDSHISNLCTKAGGQLNCLYRYKKYLSSSAKKLALNSYIYSNFSYCPIAWELSSAKSKNRIEKSNKKH